MPQHVCRYDWIDPSRLECLNRQTTCRPILVYDPSRRRSLLLELAAHGLLVGQAKKEAEQIAQEWGQGRSA